MADGYKRREQINSLDPLNQSDMSVRVLKSMLVHGYCNHSHEIAFV